MDIADMGTKKEMELSTFGRAYMHSDENFALMGLSSSADVARPKEKKWMIMKMIKKKERKKKEANRSKWPNSGANGESLTSDDPWNLRFITAEDEEAAISIP